MDAVLLVFGLHSRESFNTALAFYQQMEQHRSLSRLPVILVGTQDNCGPTSPREITEEEGRSIAMRFNLEGYFETNATHGLKVEEVFKTGKFFLKFLMFFSLKFFFLLRYFVA